MSDEYKWVRLRKQTWMRLNGFTAKTESYDTAINRIMDEAVFGQTLNTSSTEQNMVNGGGQI